MNHFQRAAAALLLAGAGAPVAADEISGQVARWQAGVVCASQFARGRDAANDISFIAETQVVPAMVGMGFGVRAQVAGADLPVTIVVDHPPFGAGGQTRQTYSTTLSSRALSGFFYQFENPAEAAPGLWRVSAFAGPTLVYSLDFEVVPPRAGDGLIAACG